MQSSFILLLNKPNTIFAIYARIESDDKRRTRLQMRLIISVIQHVVLLAANAKNYTMNQVNFMPDALILRRLYCL